MFNVHQADKVESYPLSHKIFRKFEFTKTPKLENMSVRLWGQEKGGRQGERGKPEETKRGSKMEKR